MVASDYRAEARKRLQGKWGKAIGIEFAFFLFFLVAEMILGIFPRPLASIISIGIVVVEIPLMFGLIISFVKLYNGENVEAFDYFTTGFKNFGKSWGIAFFTFLKLLVPFIIMFVSLILISASAIGSATTMFMARAYNVSTAPVARFSTLAIIGTIMYIVSYIWFAIEAYYYKIVYMVGAESENLSSKEIVAKSKELMAKRRWRLFCLEFSFIGWVILAVLSFGIGMIWLAPYMEYAEIAFYKDANGKFTKSEEKTLAE